MGGLLSFPGEGFVTRNEEDGTFKEDGLRVGIFVFDGYLIPICKVDSTVILSGDKLDFPGSAFIGASA
ncbi:MAG: hypothetical protein LBB80_00075, partial [Treponema sp.]|nr:hypothetical protein [Treponema sp.]